MAPTPTSNFPDRGGESPWRSVFGSWGWCSPYILNLLVFRTERTGGLIGVADVAAAFLAGGFVPLDILPLHGLWLVLPFRFAGWFPAQIFSGRVKFAELPRELGLLLRWLLLLPLIRLTIWQLGLRRCRCSKPSTAGLIPLPAGAGGGSPLGGDAFYPHGARAVLRSRTPYLSGAVE
ncbi:hypothetical protein DRJ58_05260, partial [Candidatus Acetothermia bacterium]